MDTETDDDQHHRHQQQGKHKDNAHTDSGHYGSPVLHGTPVYSQIMASHKLRHLPGEDDADLFVKLKAVLSLFQAHLVLGGLRGFRRLIFPCQFLKKFLADKGLINSHI